MREPAGTASSPWARLLDAALVAGALVMLSPLLWAALASLKPTNQELFAHPFALPARPTLRNLQRALEEGQLGAYAVNSLLVTGLSVTLVSGLGLFAGYSLSRRDTPLRAPLLALFALGAALPVEAYLIPLGSLLSALGVHDSLWALILPYTASNLPLAVLLCAAWCSGLPRELEEAALLDGVSTARFYLEIVLPVSRPVVATVAALTALACWNELLLALLLVQDPARRTVPAGLVAFQHAHGTDYPALLAGLTLISLVSLLAYVVFNRQVVSGVAEGAVK